MNVYIAQWTEFHEEIQKNCKQQAKNTAQCTEFIEEIQKVNNPLTKHTDPESQK